MINCVKLIPANKARIMSDKKQVEKLEVEYNTITDLIQKAINDGDYEVTLYYLLRKAITDELERLGYVVRYTTYRNESITTISWKEDNQ